jgi:very-short-patch-repair endonuclease
MYLKYYDVITELRSMPRCNKLILKLLHEGHSRNDILNAYCTYHIIKNEDKIGSLIANYKDNVNSVNKLEDDKISVTINNTENTCSKIVKSMADQMPMTFQQIHRDLHKRSNRKSIRQILSESVYTIKCYRVWMLTPEVVSDIIPLIENLFDIVIFDEASQMYLYKALPSLYRAKKAVVAGDDKQSKEVISEENGEILEETTGKDTSLLDQAKINFSSITLTFHYRAKFAELIQYSNYAFYNGRLKLAPNVIRSNENNRPIEFIKVEGVRDDSKNIIEANRTVELINELLEHGNDTIGIITLNSKQKELIEDTIDDRCNNDRAFASLISHEKSREDNGEFVGLFIKSIEEVQGDERDIIIMSLGLGLNENNKVALSQLGPIIKDGGPNRLNVMISRSKKKQYVMSSVYASNIDLGSSSSDGARIFKEFLQYAQAISDLNYESIKHILGSSTVNAPTFDSPFEEQVYLEITKLGYMVETQVGVRGYRIDIAVYDNQLGRYIVGIECDGATYHSSKSARERDITRQRFLESRGWKILRIWSRNWWKDSSSEVQRIKYEIEKAKESIQLEVKAEQEAREREQEKLKQLNTENKEINDDEKILDSSLDLDVTDLDVTDLDVTDLDVTDLDVDTSDIEVDNKDIENTTVEKHYANAESHRDEVRQEAKRVKNQEIRNSFLKMLREDPTYKDIPNISEEELFANSIKRIVQDNPTHSIIELALVDESEVTGYKPVAMYFDMRRIEISKWYQILTYTISSVVKADKITCDTIQNNIGKTKIICSNKNDCAKPVPINNINGYFIESKQSAYSFITKSQKVLSQSTGDHTILIEIDQSEKKQRTGKNK